MFYKIIKITFIFIALILAQVYIISCRNNDTVENRHEAHDVKEPLIQANKKAVQTETDQINDFLRRYKWKMTETGSGLRYMVYEEGMGNLVKPDDLVELEYTVSLLNGDTVYRSDDLGFLVFYAGRAQVISGLEEGILLLKPGDRAKFIIPSHLAFGLIGDQDKIGSKTTLVYDVKVLRTK